MVSWSFLQKVTLRFIVLKILKYTQKKMSKKNDFHFLKLFFKNENWTFIFVHFGI
jgi:hypothetical protein